MKTIDPKEQIDWRMSASQALSKAEGEMTKVAIGGLVAAAAVLEGTCSIEGEKALRSVVEALDGCAAIAAESIEMVQYTLTQRVPCCSDCPHVVDGTPQEPLLRDDDVDVLKFDARKRP